MSSIRLGTSRARTRPGASTPTRATEGECHARTPREAQPGGARRAAWCARSNATGQRARACRSVPSRTRERRVEEFDAFYAATAAALVRQVFAVTGDLAEAQDCVQEAYARAWQRWS